MDAPPPSVGLPEPRSGAAATVLIVDDCEDIRQLVRWQLRRRPDLQISGEAATGAEAVWACEELHPDVVILDVEMPVSSGLEALEAIRVVSPTSQVVVYSARDDAPTRESARLLGAAEFVVKRGGGRTMLEALDRLGIGQPRVPSPRPATDNSSPGMPAPEAMAP